MFFSYVTVTVLERVISIQLGEKKKQIPKSKLKHFFFPLKAAYKIGFLWEILLLEISRNIV